MTEMDRTWVDLLVYSVAPKVLSVVSIVQERWMDQNVAS